MPRMTGIVVRQIIHPIFALPVTHPMSLYPQI